MREQYFFVAVFHNLLIKERVSIFLPSFVIRSISHSLLSVSTATTLFVRTTDFVAFFVVFVFIFVVVAIAICCLFRIENDNFCIFFVSLLSSKSSCINQASIRLYFISHHLYNTIILDGKNTKTLTKWTFIHVVLCYYSSTIKMLVHLQQTAFYSVDMHLDLKQTPQFCCSPSFTLLYPNPNSVRLISCRADQSYSVCWTEQTCLFWAARIGSSIVDLHRKFLLTDTH